MRHQYLVLGGTGFIGSHLVDELARGGHFVRVLARPQSVHMAERWPNPRIEVVVGDFNNPVVIDQVVRDCDAVFHLVATTLPKSSNENPVFDVETNVIGTLRLLDAARRNGVRKVVFASSGGTIYGRTEVSPIPESHATNPTCSHGISKLMIEKYLRLHHELYGLDYCSLRIANPYGMGQRTEKAQGAVGVLLERVLNGRPFEIWGDGTIVRDYVYVSDVVNAIIASAEKREGSRVYNVGTGRGTSLNELVDHVEEATGRRAQRIYMPGRSFDIQENVLDTKLATQELGWTAKVSIADGLLKTLEWGRENARLNAALRSA